MTLLSLPHRRRRFRQWDERGTVMVEYVVLLTLVSIGAVTATLTLGPPLVRWYQLERVFILVGVP